MSWTRRWHRVASSVVLIAAGAHAAQHWRAYVAPDLGDPVRRHLVETLQAHVLYAPLGTTMWTALGFFSLGYAALLVLFGTTHWILAREAEPRVLRRHALRNAVLCALALLATLLLHPLPLGVVIFGAASLLYALAAVPRPLDL
jgi:hypothetical protein